MNICAFCGSSEDLDASYYHLASQCGEIIGKSGHNLIYGAGKIGLMGRLAQSTRDFGGKSIGIIPERLRIEGVASDMDNEQIITPDMKTRKDVMRNRSDAFLALPGGFGTMEELLEVITLKQLQYHNKAIVLLNGNGFFDEMLVFFERMYKENFANPSYRKLYQVESSPEKAIAAIENYRHEHIYDKYLKS
ncbi:MAG: TIGR00730 family Rossman fold protein [Bacteroidales bacterium]|jgi:uncharacterized protein (TIGR00730 family)|nr:TIGR00730 family Rossman fold protein [Bacteroidales bacterium]